MSDDGFFDGSNELTPITKTGKTGMDHVQELAGRLIDTREAKEKCEAKLSAIKSDIQAIEIEMANAMTRGEYGKFTVWGKTFYISERTHVSARAECKDSLVEWLDQAGHGDIATRTVHPQTLRSLVRELREANDNSLPGQLSDLLNIHSVPTINIRKG
jgi:hypothetical protein